MKSGVHCERDVVMLSLGNCYLNQSKLLFACHMTKVFNM